MFNKTKNFIKKFKKIIIGFLIGGTALAAGLGVIDMTPRIEAISLDGKNVSVNYTDENSNESLIIHSDQRDYFGLGTVGIIVSVYNTGQNQNVKFAVSTPNKQGWEMIKVQEYGGETDVIVLGTPEIITATGTIQAILSQTIKKTIWNDVGQKQYQETGIVRKEIKGEKTEKESNSFYIAKGETKFFKIQLKYSSSDEFFIEAFGDGGGYGHLDPWTYEQNFNGLTTGDLNGQDSWSGPVMYDVASTAYEGSQGVTATPDAQSNVITRTITGISSGSVYFALRKVATPTAGTIFFFAFGDSAVSTSQMRIYFEDNGNISILNGTDNSNVNLLSGTASINTWYPVNVEFDDAAQPDKYRARVYSSGSWQSFSSWYPVLSNATYTNINTILVRTNETNSSNLFHFDTITATDPTPAPAVQGEEYQIIFEE